MKIDKKKLNKIHKYLWTYFQPMHEHLGFENAISIIDITKYTLKRVSVANGHKKTCPYFLELFTRYMGNIIHRTILNPTNKKWYIRGLLCEPVQESKQHRIGYYYFPKNKEEYMRIKVLAKQQLTASEIKYDLRIIQGGSEHLKQLSYGKQGQDKQKELT